MIPITMDNFSNLISFWETKFSVSNGSTNEEVRRALKIQFLFLSHNGRVQNLINILFSVVANTQVLLER